MNLLCNVLLYTHDYEMMNTVANRIITLKEEGIHDFAGKYEELVGSPDTAE